MGAERFIISEVNPNDVVGGGGCACSERKHEDCGGPFAVFGHQEMANNLSPHLVLCLGCAEAVVTAAADPLEIKYAGQPGGKDGDSA